MTKTEIIEKVKSAPSYVREHWNKPAEGEYLSLKEFVAYIATQAGSYIFLSISGIVTFSASYFCGAIMEISQTDFSIINIITTIVNYILIITNPFTMLMYENHGRLTKKMSVLAHVTFIAELLIGIGCYFIPKNAFENIIDGLPQLVGNLLVVSGLTNYLTWFVRRFFCAKHGRFKPFVIFCAFPSAILISVIPFLPVDGMSYTNKLIVLHFAFTLMNWFYNNYVNVNGIVTFMTPNSQERQKLHSIVPIFTGFFSSVISMILPMLIAITGGYQNIKTYRVFVPIFTFLGAAVSMGVFFCKERVIEAPIEIRKKVKFLQGAKNVLKNKYLWIINISNTVGQWQWLVGSLLSWWFVYSLRMEWLSGVAANIVVVGMTLGNILCPILTKKFEKRNILISTRFLTMITLLGIALAVKMESIVVFIIAMLLRNTIQPIVDGVGLGLNADVQDYHQWKYGERSDSISGVFGWFLNPIGAGIGYIMPWLLARVGFTSDWGVLYDQKILNSVFSLYTWGTLAGLVLVTLPFIFYDLTREKHDQCVEELKERLRLEEAERAEKDSQREGA